MSRPETLRLHLGIRPRIVLGDVNSQWLLYAALLPACISALRAGTTPPASVNADSKKRCCQHPMSLWDDLVSGHRHVVGHGLQRRSAVQNTGSIGKDIDNVMPGHHPPVPSYIDSLRDSRHPPAVRSAVRTCSPLCGSPETIQMIIAPFHDQLLQAAAPDLSFAVPAPPLALSPAVVSSFPASAESPDGDDALPEGLPRPTLAPEGERVMSMS